ncbi:unnamed protein product, partial [marine sediment metagenome]
ANVTPVYDGSFSSSVVAPTYSGIATRMAFSRQTAYASNRFWVFFGRELIGGTSPEIHYTSSVDGVSWETSTKVCDGHDSAGAEFSIWVEGNDVFYVSAYGHTWGGYDPLYGYGHFQNDGIINWEVQNHVINTTDTDNSDPSICRNSTGAVFCAWWDGNGNDADPVVVWSTTEDGNFTESPEGLYYLNNELPCEATVPCVVPLLNGDVYAYYSFTDSEESGNQNAWGRKWNASAGIWDAEETLTGVDISGSHYGNFGVTAVGNDVHVAYVDRTTA